MLAQVSGLVFQRRSNGLGANLRGVYPPSAARRTASRCPRRATARRASGRPRDRFSGKLDSAGADAPLLCRLAIHRRTRVLQRRALEKRQERLACGGFAAARLFEHAVHLLRPDEKASRIRGASAAGEGSRTHMALGETEIGFSLRVQINVCPTSLV